MSTSIAIPLSSTPHLADLGQGLQPREAPDLDSRQRRPWKVVADDECHGQDDEPKHDADVARRDAGGYLWCGQPMRMETG